jgi:hypothetical protein
MTLPPDARALRDHLLEQCDWTETLGDDPTADVAANRVWCIGYEAGFLAGRNYREPGANPRNGNAKKFLSPWQTFALTLAQEYEQGLSDWETEFVNGFIERGYATPTDKQQAVFNKIANKLRLDPPP